MTEPKLFVILSQMEGQYMGHWSFQAPDELAIVRHLLHDPWEFQDIFWALRISVQEVEQLTPEDLLYAIQESYFNPHARTVLYLLPITQPVDCEPAAQHDSAPEGAPAG